MNLCIVHLSDIHFKDGDNPIEDRGALVAAALLAASTGIEAFIIVISGDIAQSGRETEYSLAAQFFNTLKTAIEAERPSATVQPVVIPGNHDCQLPEDEEALRKTLVGGLVGQLQESEPDRALLNSVLKAQSNFFTFASGLGISYPTDYAKIASEQTLTFGDYSVAIYTYNTALMSQRHEVQSSLLLPMKLIRERIAPDQQASVAVSVFHHPYNWLEANNSIDFRSHVESTSEIALMGHQHFSHVFKKESDTGSKLLYMEGHVLQEHGSASKSGFNLVKIDLATARITTIGYVWRNNSYLPQGNELELALRPSRAKPSRFEIFAPFSDFLNDPGLGIQGPNDEVLRLADIFTFPEGEVRSLASFEKSRHIPASKMLNYLLETKNVIVGGQRLAGKTTLAKTVFHEIHRRRETVPIWVNGTHIRGATSALLKAACQAAIERCYGPDMAEYFWQLPRVRRMLLVDNWYAAGIPSDNRRDALALLGTLFDRLLIVDDSLLQVKDYLVGDPVGALPLPDFDRLDLSGLTYSARGRIIDKWINLKFPGTAQTAEATRELEETERVIMTAIGKNTLPSVPFIVIALLKAMDHDTTNPPEAGSFGYLYEVLITTALSATNSAKAQIDKKYAFLTLLAYECFTTQSDMIEEAELYVLLDRYSHSFKVTVDRDALVTDLVSARVLSQSGGMYRFAYHHYYFYFLARYFKEHLYVEKGRHLRETLYDLADRITSGYNGQVLMFVAYITKDEGLIKRIVECADRVFSDIAPAELTTEADFTIDLDRKLELPNIPSHIDHRSERESRRKQQDVADVRQKELPAVDGCYSNDLPAPSKLQFAGSYIEILGQIIRNFPGSLPGETKLAVLKSTYLLGLRFLRAGLMISREYVETVSKTFDTTATPDPNAANLARQRQAEFRKAMAALTRILAFGSIKMVSMAVGVPDLAQAYNETLDSVGNTNASELLDLSIRLDHLDGFPLKKVLTLHKGLHDYPFAAVMLHYLVFTHMMTFRVEPREIIDKMTSLFNLKAADRSKLIDSGQKR